MRGAYCAFSIFPNGLPADIFLLPISCKTVLFGPTPRHLIWRFESSIIMSDDDFGGDNCGLNGQGENHHINSSTIDRTFDLLASQRRREVVTELRNTSDGVVSVDDLAGYIVERDFEETDYDRIRVLLHHKHLPKLADASGIDFDPRSGMVRYHGNEFVEAVLDRIAD